MRLVCKKKRKMIKLKKGENMKIALLGFGLETQSAMNFLAKKYKDAEFEIYDQRAESKIESPRNAKIFLGVKDFSEIEADLIVRTPAVNPRRLSSSKITSVTNLFFENCPAKIIGVTGSKGKGTTASFVAEILKSAGVKTHLLGNIGVPALDKIDEISPNDAVVYELSSFQLWDAQKSPFVAILNNIEPDHLDVHDGFDDYVAAKMNIALKQTKNDFFIYNSENQVVEKAVENSKNRLCGTLQNFPNKKLAHIQEGYFYWGEKRLFETSILKLAGEHNQKNALAAMIATFDFLNNQGKSMEEIIKAWREGLSKFEGLPHRLKFVREINGVKFYDDSIATTPGSAIAAMNAFAEPKVLILGGSDKGADLSELISRISESSIDELREVILIGKEAEKLNSKLKGKNFTRIKNLGLNTTMQQVVKTAFADAQSGDVVILSPAHASFDMFKSYVDRGEQFIEAVNNL